MLQEIITHKRAFRSLLMLPGGAEGAIDAIWQQAGLTPGTTLTQLIKQHFNDDAATLAGLQRIATILSAGTAKSDKKTGDGLLQWLNHPELREAFCEDYCSVFITEKKTARTTLFTKGTLTDASLIEVLLAEQARALGFAEALASLRIAQFSSHMLLVAQALLATYDELKQSRALMDYDDLILTARDLLQKSGISPWVLFKLDGGIDHVLVDEAQDTSPEQWDIINALTQEFFSGLGRTQSERSLFVVGDEKQSIFSFQGADVQMLGSMQSHFMKRISESGNPVHHIPLTHSFRSTPEVLTAVDAIFAREAAGAGLTLDKSTLAHTPRRKDEPGLVELWPLARAGKNDFASATSVLSRQLAATIHGWNNGGLWLESKNRHAEAG